MLHPFGISMRLIHYVLAAVLLAAIAMRGEPVAAAGSRPPTSADAAPVPPPAPAAARR